MNKFLAGYPVYSLSAGGMCSKPRFMSAFKEKAMDVTVPLQRSPVV